MGVLRIRGLERPGSIISDANGAPITLASLKILLSRETPSENPQYYSLELGGGGEVLSPRRISDFPHPHPALIDPPKEILRYSRDDGVDLNATLYLPPGYDAEKDGPLPTIMWAYPREFNSAEAAGQLRDSPNRFTSIAPSSPLVWLARGYAVLEGPSLPIIGDAENGVEPNDTYVEQLVAGARAAVEEVVRRGVTDPRRVAVGGHSYGAFMASNLLAHAPDLFACAVARSGRTTGRSPRSGSSPRNARCGKPRTCTRRCPRSTTPTGSRNRSCSSTARTTRTAGRT